MTALDAEKQSVERARITLPIIGMVCASCVAKVEQRLFQINGVSEVAVNLTTESATATYDPDSTSLGNLLTAVVDSGFEVPTSRKVLNISGMHCASCTARVETCLASANGVIDVAVNLATEQAIVRYVMGAVDRRELEKVVQNAGYDILRLPVASHLEEDATLEEDSVQQLRLQDQIRLRTRATIALTLGVFVLWGSADWLAGMWRPEFMQQPFMLLVLALPVQFWAGLSFYRGAWAMAKRFTADMNTLVAVGTSAAFFYSLVLTLWPNALTGSDSGVIYYYDTAMIIIGLVLLGRYLESRAKGQTSTAIRRLAGLQSKTARVERDGLDVEVAIDDLVTGNVVRVAPGDRIPADGLILAGSSALDESMVTGESMPVEKSSGDAVIGATINVTGSLRIQVTRVGDETVLSQIIRLVEEATASKAPIQRLADWISKWFVLGVLCIATATFMAWYLVGPDPVLTHALVSFVAVLVVACPCALGLATPTAIMVGIGKGAESGILIRNGEALETAGKVDVLVLDKTGTITRGIPALTDVRVLGEWDATELLQLTSVAERDSEHPIANAIVQGAKERGLELSQPVGFLSVAGGGVKAQVEGYELVVGSARLLQEEGIDVTEVKDQIARFASSGKSIVHVAIDGKLAGVIAVADSLKPESSASIRRIQEMGLRVVMLTGDNRLVGEAIARELGIVEVKTEVSPVDKVNIVRNLQAQGNIVAMAGDGINDAPALAQADLGVAMGKGTDIAMESASITLVNGDLGGIVGAIDLSKRTLRTVKQNLFWAFAYNVLLIPLAAGALFPSFGIQFNPMFAAGAMALSSLSVVLNSLRLRTYVRDADDHRLTGTL